MTDEELATIQPEDYILNHWGSIRHVAEVRDNGVICHALPQYWMNASEIKRKSSKGEYDHLYATIKSKQVLHDEIHTGARAYCSVPNCSNDKEIIYD